MNTLVHKWKDGLKKNVKKLEETLGKLMDEREM
jgi:hypothetical protein